MKLTKEGLPALVQRVALEKAPDDPKKSVVKITYFNGVRKALEIEPRHIPAYVLVNVPNTFVGLMEGVAITYWNRLKGTSLTYEECQ